MIHPRYISINDYTYDLPEDKIAFYPLEIRDASRLLVYKGGELKEDVFSNIPGYLPPGSLLVFNDTRVINARMIFNKPTGATIEIFCLKPVAPYMDFNQVMSQTGSVKWKCLIGGASKWKNEILEKKCFAGGREITLKANKEKLNDSYIVEFTWEPGSVSFADILESAGDIPLPPYIKRKPDQNDKDRYQTIYAGQEGSVAAPTAGLHFTNNILQQLEENKIQTAFVTLHVGAGTFKPVKSSTMDDHEMHSEYISIRKDTIQQLLEEKFICSVGTTSLRTLETLYWLGVKISLDPGIRELGLGQWEVYEEPLKNTTIPTTVSFRALLGWMEKNDLQYLIAPTQLLIAPGYSFRVVKVLITNFHQPRSTLLLLVAAAIGNWKKIYDYAMENNFRFLSYGDASLLFMDES
ncbi:MAG TPA: S-adenosylmethionine:tRNA ribosyltransferase-isomerase [Ferruginibacter sp.]|nr:S-adenosylmethionine:tRNA ribosyltransferase-isomerase [Ferruginibacter sp.]